MLTIVIIGHGIVIIVTIMIRLPCRVGGATKSIAAYIYRVRLALAPGCRGSCVRRFSSLHLKTFDSVALSSVDCTDTSNISIGT